MAKKIEKLNYTMSAVAFCCLVTAVLLEMWTGSEQQNTVVTSPVSSAITLKDEDKTRHFWAKSEKDDYNAVKKWTIVKYLVVAAASMMLVALVMVYAQKRVKDKLVYRTLDFISKVLIIVSGIYLCTCFSALISVANDPERVYQTDQNALKNLKLVALIVALTALVSHMMYRKQKIERDIVHV